MRASAWSLEKLDNWTTAHSWAVDDKHHVITGALADFASKKDSDSLEQIVAQAKENLEQNNITLEEVIADAAYSSGKALKYLAQANIKGWIPNFGQ